MDFGVVQGVMDGKTMRTIPSHGSLIAIANKLKIEIIPNGWSVSVLCWRELKNPVCGGGGEFQFPPSKFNVRYGPGIS
jgi:hypothetical protein